REHRCDGPRRRPVSVVWRPRCPFPTRRPEFRRPGVDCRGVCCAREGGRGADGRVEPRILGDNVARGGPIWIRRLGDARTCRGGLYGTAIATMGMLSTAVYILAMDTFGPIVDNGAGIIEMSGMSEGARRNMDKLDAAGNTTKALTKGYAVGSAALAAFLLFNAFLTEAQVKAVDLAHPETFIGAFMGAALVFLFTAFAIRAVGRAAWSIIKDVRDQF